MVSGGAFCSFLSVSGGLLGASRPPFGTLVDPNGLQEESKETPKVIPGRFFLRFLEVLGGSKGCRHVFFLQVLDAFGEV